MKTVSKVKSQMLRKYKENAKTNKQIIAINATTHPLAAIHLNLLTQSSHCSIV